MSGSALSLGLSHTAHAQAVPIVSLAPITDQSVTVGAPVTFTAFASDSDASGTIAYGVVGAPPGSTIDPVSGNFSWNTTNAATGIYSFSVTAIGSTGGSDSTKVNINVNPPAVANDGTGGTATTTGGTIATGDAAASTTVENGLNSNTVSPDSTGKTNSSTITASSTNDGILGSAATSTSDTGTNSVTGGDGSNSIVTGNAVSTANVINEVNTNIFNSNGLIIFLNQIFGGGIDLNTFDLSYFLQGGPGASPTISNPITNSAQCTLLTCLNSSSLNVLNTNTATVTNSVIVRSSTGSNTASSTDSATVDTGNAYAAANVLNLVNTNIVNSSYLLVSFNNFGDLAQNITLPSSGFFQQLFQHGGTTPNLNSSTYTATNDNIATTTGSVTAEAGTGTNTTTSVPTGTTTPSGVGNISTGDAYSSANTFNQVNTNNFGGTSVFMLFRVSGNFSGSIIGLPSGLVATTTPDGIEITSADAADAALALSMYEASSTFNSSHFAANATNTAAVQNNVDVSAQTGDNAASTELGTSTINTGNAYAAADVVNLVNTNIVGQNWIFAIFNIFGNFSGNIDFGGGSPALALAGTPSNPSPTPGSTETYTFTVTNTGNADASNVVLNTSFPAGLLTFTSGNTTATGQSWNLGSILEGQTQTFTMTATVANVSPCQSISVPLTAPVLNDSITTPTPSGTANSTIAISSPAPAANCVTLPAVATSGGGGSGGGGGGGGGAPQQTWTLDPQISVVKSVDVSTTSAPTSVNYKVVVRDPDSAGPAYNATLTDTLTDPSGATMYTRSWDLATINPGDEIDLTYAVAYGTSTKPGMYHNTAVVTGQSQYIGNITKTLGSGSGSVYFLSNGQVLGDATSTIAIATSTLATLNASSTVMGEMCSPLLSSFLRPGSRAPDVIKLQAFLAATGSDIPLTGFFGPMTTAAVKSFQITYANDILAPVGLSRPTGMVFAATIRKINQLVCGGADPTGAVLGAATVNAGEIAPTTSPPAPKAGNGGKHRAAIVVNPTAGPIVTQTSSSAPDLSTPISTTSHNKKSGFFGGLFGNGF